MGKLVNLFKALFLHLWILFSILLIVFSGFCYSIRKRNILNIEKGTEETENTMKENDMQIEEFSVNEFTSPQCVKIGDNKPLALQMNGDVVIGGIFPLHYLVPELQPNYQDKPPITVCNG